MVSVLSKILGVGVIPLVLGLSGEMVVPAQISLPFRSVPSSEVNPMAGLDQGLWGPGNDRSGLLRAIDQSLAYLNSPKAISDYKKYTAPNQPGAVLGPNLRQRVIQSLQRFRQLVIHSPNPQALKVAVKNEFAFYQSVGNDQAGTVHFTGYYEAVYAASLVSTPEYRYPIYGRPADFQNWPHPHPTRRELEGEDGLQGSQGKLKGLELAWLKDRLEAFLIQVQGSAQLQLTNGQMMTVGYAGKTNFPYTSIGQELIKDGKIPREELTLPRLIAYFQANPLEMDNYIPRNESFVFFRNTQGGQAEGSINVPVTAERSIATDKSLWPPGALAIINTVIPPKPAQGHNAGQPVSRFVLDQDTGSAIKGPGRVDIFMGTGNAAKARAGLINTDGELYYLLLK
ncbi:murein transglycosylase A [Synechococcus sp. PCC 6312]|uniref:murein transglycosylase A n=1 Tax=Synechococcus sp. (strain ATCC 27167 / PCC 6312) TaxID=195253 RepID=UPI00029ED901|nr:membrane-bound lytic murein transglycosylase [Synechococcus sp. PCC 6312]